MNNRNNLDHDNDQLVLSFELLKLMQWIIEHETEGLKRLIKRALAKGLIHDKYDRNDDSLNGTDLQLNIIDFMHLMEMLLSECLDEQSSTSATHNNLMPALRKIDSTICDDSTVRFSLEHATSQLERQPQANPKELLFKELLKRWKPAKNNQQN